VDDRIRSMLFQRPSSIPVSVGILPAAWRKHREALDDLVSEFPGLFGSNANPRDYDAVYGTYVEGRHVDVWGCVWENIHTGREAIVTGHPYPTRESVRSIRPPEKDAGFPHGFMFLRITDLRGFEEAMVDFAEEPPELRLLIDTVLEYNLRQADLLLRQLGEPQIVYFGDDLGMQTSLPISPEKWRKWLKPCFAAIYRKFRDAGHWVYMHTDGHILEIIPDLIDCGVNVVNPQVRANGIDNLARIAKGRVCIDLDLDRQMFPFCTPADVDAHVREAVEKLGSPEGGLWLKAEIGDDVPLPICRAIFEALERYRFFFS
jgi:uroporphyrinogen decarboxylase